MKSATNQRSSTVFGVMPQNENVKQDMEARNNIAHQNLQLIQNSQKKVQENRAMDMHKRRSEVSDKIGFNSKEKESILSKTPQGTEPTNQFTPEKSLIIKKNHISPLNKRLDEMKKNLHNLMFSTGMDTELADIHEDQSEYANAHQRNNEFQNMHQNIMHDLQEANGQVVNADMVINQNYNMLNLQPNTFDYQQNQYDYNQDQARNLTFLASRSESHTGVDRPMVIRNDVPNELSTVQSQERTLQHVINQTNEYQHPTASPPVQMNTIHTHPDVNDTTESPDAQEQATDNNAKIMENANTDEGTAEPQHMQAEQHSPNIKLHDASSLSVVQNDDQKLTTEEDAQPAQKSRSSRMVDNGASNMTIDKIIKSEKEDDEQDNNERSDTQPLQEEDTAEAKGTESPAVDSIFANQLTDVQLQNYYSIDKIEQMQNEAQQIDASSISEYASSGVVAEFQDKAFEEDFKKLVDRLNTNLKMHDRSDLMVSQIEEDIKVVNEQKRLFEIQKKKEFHRINKTQADSSQQSPFKSSHISHIQALIGHRDQYAARLREFDQAKSTQSHQFIKEKLAQPQRQAQNSVNTFGPMKQNGANVQISGDQSTNFMSHVQSSANKVNSQGVMQQHMSPQGNVNFGPAFGAQNASDGQLGTVSSQPGQHYSTQQQNQQHGLNRINSPSTDMNEDYQYQNQMMQSDPSHQLPFIMAINDQQIAPQSIELTDQDHSRGNMATSHEKIQNQIRVNQQSYRNFKDYLKNVKRTDRNGEPIQLKIEGVTASQTNLSAQGSHYLMEQIAQGGGIQYVGNDGTIYYHQAQDGTVTVGGQQYAFGYPNGQMEQMLYDQVEGQENPTTNSQTMIRENEDTGLNKQLLNEDSQGLIPIEEFQQQDQNAQNNGQFYQIEGQRYQGAEVIQIPVQSPEPNQFNADLSIEVTEPNRIHQTSADQLDTVGSGGSDGHTWRIPGQISGINSGVDGRAHQNSKQQVNFEFTSQQTLQVGSKEAIGHEADPNYLLSQKQIQAHVLRNHKRITERGNVGSDPNQVEGNLMKEYLEGQKSTSLLSEDVGEPRRRETVEFQQNRESAAHITSLQEASDSKLSKNQLLRPMILGGQSPQRIYRDMATSGILLVPEDPAEARADTEGREPGTRDQGQSTAKSLSQRQFHAVVSKNIAVEVGPGATEPKIISKPGPKGRRSNKQNFQSLKPKVANQLLILPDMQILSPLHIHKMSPQSSREHTIKNMQDSKQNILLSLERNKYSTAYAHQSMRPSPHASVRSAQQAAAQRQAQDGTLATIDASQASSKIHVFQRDPSKAGGLAARPAGRIEGTENRFNTAEDTKEISNTHKKVAHSALRQPDNGDLGQLDQIIKSEVVIPQDGSQERLKDQLGFKSQRNPTILGEHVTKSNSQETLKTQMLYNKLSKVESLRAKAAGQQGIFNYIKVQASHQEVQPGIKIKQKTLNRVEPVLHSSVGGFADATRRLDIEIRKKNEQEAQERIARGQNEQRNAKNKVMGNSKLHRYKYAATLEQARLAENPHLAHATYRSHVAGSMSPGSINVRAKNSPDRTHTTKFMSKQHSRDSFKKTLKDGSISKMDHSASEMANLKGSVYGITLNEQGSIMQIKPVRKPDPRKHNINVESEPGTAILEGNPLKKTIAINSQESDNNTDRGPDDVKGFHTALDIDSDQKGGVSNGALNFVSSNADIENAHRRYKSNDPRAIYQNAKQLQQDMELNEKKRRVLAINQQKKALKARGKSLAGGNTKKKDGNFEAVKMNSLLTLEELLTIHTKQVNDQILPFVIGPKTTTHKQSSRKPSKDLPQSSGQSMSIYPSRNAELPHAAASSGFHLQTWAYEGAQSRVDTVNKRSQGSSFDHSGLVKSSDKHQNIHIQADSSSARPSANQTQHGGVKLKMRLDKDGNSRAHQQIDAKARITQATPFGAINIEPMDLLRETNPDIANGTKTFAGKKKTSAGSPGTSEKGPLNLTLQPFKAILISNPWEQGQTQHGPTSIPSSKNKHEKGQALTQSKLQMHSNARGSNAAQILSKSPTGVFRNSPTKTQQSIDEKGRHSKQSAQRKNHQIRGSISSGRIQGFGGISNANQTGFNMLMLSPNAHGESVNNIHDINMNSHQDFTIEEKLNEESYLSKDNFKPFGEEKTMEYKVEGQFSSSARNTTEAFKAAIQTATRLGDTPIQEVSGPGQPMIRIQNNQLETTGLISDASIKSQTVHRIPGNSPPQIQ